MGELNEMLGLDGRNDHPYAQACANGIKQRRLQFQRAALERRLSKLRIKGPINGRLFVCYDWRKPGRCATALCAEGALAAWKSYWSDKP